MLAIENRWPIGVAFVMALFAAGSAQGQRPASKVVTATGQMGVLSPRAEFRGTVYFKEVSEVATEVSGKVVAVDFEEGQRVTKGQLLVRLDDALLVKDLQATKATRDRFQADLEDAEVRFGRAKVLVDDGLNPPQEGDELRFNVESLGHRVRSTKAEVARIETLIEKYSIHAPFDGIVLERKTELGEWRSIGDTVAVVARENVFDVMVDVPEVYLSWIVPGQTVGLTAGGRALEGKVVTVIARGDVATRTFPVKVRIEEDDPLYEGMAAIVQLPTGKETTCILVSRDAVLHQAGESVVFTVEGSIAKRHAVTVLGFQGLSAGIVAPGLNPQCAFIVKGHERLRGGDTVTVVSGVKFAPEN